MPAVLAWGPEFVSLVHTFKPGTEAHTAVPLMSSFTLALKLFLPLLLQGPLGPEGRI